MDRGSELRLLRKARVEGTVHLNLKQPSRNLIVLYYSVYGLRYMCRMLF